MIMYNIASATAATATFGTYPFVKDQIENGFSHNPKLREYMGVISSVLLTGAISEFVEEAINVVSNPNGKACFTLLKLNNAFSFIPFLVLVSGSENRFAKRYIELLPRIQQVSALAISITIAIYGSPAYGITSAAWVVYGFANEMNLINKRVNEFVLGSAVISSLAICFMEKHLIIPNPADMQVALSVMSVALYCFSKYKLG